MAKTKSTKAKQNDSIELTQDAYNSLVQELEYRTTDERKKIAEEIASARELGDLSENHPYAVAMEKKSMNEDKIVELEDMIKKAHIVKSNNSTNIVTIGKKVQIVNVKTKSKRVVELVGTEQTQAADPAQGKISVDSPIGKALLNAKLGDTVTVVLPLVKVEYKIEKFI